jgi:formate dehydrogenase subunit gamma
MSRVFRRYADITRLNHWFVALMFLCAGLSGLSFFHPALFFLTQLFGGGPWTRILHPFFGLLMVSGFALLFAQVWRENLWHARDTAWLRAAPRLMATADESSMPPAGKYNAGQKAVVWAFAVSLVLLLLTGFVFWQPWFADYFPVPLRRIAVVVHAASAVLLILSVITHVYAAIWVKGTIGAMTRGTVSAAWARHNHPLWYRQMGGDGRHQDKSLRG